MSSQPVVYTDSLALVYKIIEFQGYDFAVESFNARYFMVSMIGSDLPGKLAAKTKAAIKAAIIAIYEELTPTPSPAAPAALPIRIYEQTTAVAVSNSKQEGKIELKHTKAQQAAQCRLGFHDMKRVAHIDPVMGKCPNCKQRYAREITDNKCPDCETALVNVVGSYTKECKHCGYGHIPALSANSKPQTPAAPTPSTEHTIRITQKPSKREGRYYTIQHPREYQEALDHFTKMHCKPNVILTSPDSDHILISSFGIAFEESGTVPANKVWIGYDPAKAA